MRRFSCARSSAAGAGDLYGLRPTDVMNSLRFGFDTAWNGTAAQYAPSWFHDPSRKIRLKLGETALRTLRRAGPSRLDPVCAFWVNDRPVGQARCREGLETEAELGRAVVSWVAHPGERHATARNDEAIAIRDIKIASIGNSFSSGEGNPHTRYVFGSVGAPAQWWDDRCHRSLVSSGALAAARSRHRDEACFSHLRELRMLRSRDQAWHPQRIPGEGNGRADRSRSTPIRSDRQTCHSTAAVTCRRRWIGFGRCCAGRAPSAAWIRRSSTCSSSGRAETKSVSAISSATCSAATPAAGPARSKPRWPGSSGACRMRSKTYPRS